MSDSSLPIERGQPVTPGEIATLRAAVGWDRCEDSQERVLRGSERYYTVRDQDRLIGFLNVISDGVADALLVNVIVHPDFQRKGLGQALVRRAVSDLTADGIQCIQTTFLPDREEFYRKCGFYILGGGIVDNAASKGANQTAHQMSCNTPRESGTFNIQQSMVVIRQIREEDAPAFREVL